MNQLKKIRTGLVIAALFTGIAIWNGVYMKDWVSVTYFSVLALVFLLLGIGKRTSPES